MQTEGSQSSSNPFPLCVSRCYNRVFQYIITQKGQFSLPFNMQNHLIHCKEFPLLFFHLKKPSLLPLWILRSANHVLKNPIEQVTREPACLSKDINATRCWVHSYLEEHWWILWLMHSPQARHIFKQCPDELHYPKHGGRDWFQVLQIVAVIYRSQWNRL